MNYNKLYNEEVISLTNNKYLFNNSKLLSYIEIIYRRYSLKKIFKLIFLLIFIFYLLSFTISIIKIPKIIFQQNKIIIKSSLDNLYLRLSNIKYY